METLLMIGVGLSSAAVMHAWTTFAYKTGFKRGWQQGSDHGVKIFREEYENARDEVLTNEPEPDPRTDH